MDKEYSKNQKEQRKSFKKYRKYIKRSLLYGAIAIASAFVIPYEGLYTLLQGYLGESLAASATFFIQWGIAGFSALGSIFNAFNANRERKKIEDTQDEAENIFDSVVNENDELKKKVENLEKTKTKLLEEAKIKTIDDKEKVIPVRAINNSNENKKNYVK